MKKLMGVLLVVSMVALVGGCAAPAASEIKTSPERNTTVPPVGNFNDRMNNLADQLHANVVANNPANTYIVTSFSSLDKLSDTTSLGRLIAENLIHGLQLHKWQILEVRLTKGLDVNAAGEFFLSRDINKLKDEYKISGVVAGTYSVAEGNLTINARVIDINTGIVISSAQTYIPVSWLPDPSIFDENSNKGMKIIDGGVK